MNPSAQISPSVQITPIPTLTPTPTVTAKEKSELNIEILNSTTKAGLASQVAKLFEAEDFNKPATGNAEEKDQNITSVKIKISENVYQDEIVKILTGQYNIEPETSYLSPESENDIEITLGLDVLE